MIVFDEAHVILTSSGFRESMNDVRQAMTCRIPLTLLSATLPTRLVQGLVDKLNLPKETNVVRAPTNRQEHHYAIWRVHRQSLVKTTAAFIYLCSSLLHGSQRGIVFVQRKDEGKKLAECFRNLDFIHGGIEEEVVLGMIHRWKSGLSGGWIIGTTSLIQGVDYHDVHLIVFMGPTFGMIDLVQGAGRAGRNGKNSRVVVLNTNDLYQNKGDNDDFGCRKELINWLQDNGCRRVGISQCMDGIASACETLPNAYPCDVCGRDEELDDVWEKAGLLDISHVSGGGPVQLTLGHTLPLSTGHLIQTQDNSPMQLDVAPLVSRVAPLVALRKSNEENVLKADLEKIATVCFEKLLEFGGKCATCFLAHQKLTNEKHSSFVQCWGGQFPPHWASIYDYNKPTKNRKKVSVISPCQLYQYTHTLLYLLQIGRMVLQLIVQEVVLDVFNSP